MVGLLDKFKKSGQEKPAEKPAERIETKVKPAVAKKVQTKPKQPPAEKSTGSSPALRGKTDQAYRILLKPLVTEKAADLGTFGKYVFMVDPSINKVEIKKAIRSIYGVDPVKINISNFSGKLVRYGRSWGRRKHWKKAVVTLRPGDKIEIYEGV